MKNKDKLKIFLQFIVEKITGKSCYKCKHCVDGFSCDNYPRYSECVTRIYPCGFEPKEKGGAE